MGRDAVPSTRPSSVTTWWRYGGGCREDGKLSNVYGAERQSGSRYDPVSAARDGVRWQTRRTSRVVVVKSRQEEG